MSTFILNILKIRVPREKSFFTPNQIFDCAVERPHTDECICGHEDNKILCGVEADDYLDEKNFVPQRKMLVPRNATGCGGRLNEEDVIL